MPGQSNTNPVIFLKSVDSAVSSLKTCQMYIKTGIEITTGIALDLIERGGEVEEVNNLENVILEYVSIGQELDQFIQAVGDVTHQIQQERPERMPDLKALVDKRFSDLKNGNRKADLLTNDTYIDFKQQLDALKRQVSGEWQNESTSTTEVDEDIAVTQTQRNFTCPITQLFVLLQKEMERPVKNKICGHNYEEEAIIKIIQNKRRQKKKARCPVIGCDNGDVKQSDLSVDTTLKRSIENQKKQHNL
uniref:E3 SUMO-protein ligase NSE2 n=1 Tax=Callorhinchus milii TaxID=7868 RepID=V9KYE8_CALMI